MTDTNIDADIDIDSSQDRAPDPEAIYHKRISVAASPATVFALLSEPDRLRRWQSIVSSVDLRVGGDYSHLVVPGAVARGTFTEVEPERRLVFTWGWDGNDGVPPGSSTVTVELQPDGDRTIIDFTHDGLPDVAAAESHAEGWNHYLDRLSVAAETGDAGRDDWSAGPEDMDALGAAEASLAIMLDLLRSVDDGDRDRATPCSEYTLDALIEHLTGSLTRLGSASGTPVAAADEGADLEARVADVATAALSAWRDRGTEGDVEFLGGPMPATVPVAIILAELFVHAWDVARTLEQPFEPAGHVVAVADESVRGVMPADRGDAFAPPLPDDGLDQVDALMAFTGRSV